VLMKHGVLVLAHQYPDHLTDLIKCFDEDFYFYIHIDEKSKFSSSDIAELKKISRVQFVSQKLRILWGGFNHLNAILLLATEALRQKELKYFHVISGQDYLTKPVHVIKKIFEDNPADYMDYFEVLHSKWEKEWLERISLYGPYEIFNSKSFFGNKILTALIVLQRKLGFKRKLPDIKLFGGSGWWSLSRESVEYVMNYTERNPSLLKRLRYTFCADEIYFQTILMNSPLKGKVINNNLRFIDWTKRNGSFPANLDESDFQTLVHSDKIFARKFDFPVSEKLKQLLEKFLKESKA
jgi:hypothetical protein